MPQVITASQAKQQFSDILNNAYYNGKEYIVERHGQPIIHIYPISRKEHQNNETIQTLQRLGQVSLNVPDEWEKIEQGLEDMNG